MSCTRVHVSFFNSPQFVFGLFGHSGIVVERQDRTCHLYSFHPVPNNGEPFGPGSIAQIANPDDGRDLDRFIRASMTHHPDDGREDDRGIQLFNGTKFWYERIRRIVRMEVTADQALAIESYAMAIAEDPPQFNVAVRNCEDFVDKALGAGGIELWGKRFSLRNNPVPNLVYELVTDNTTGITGFQKIDFKSYLVKSASFDPVTAYGLPSAALAASAITSSEKL